MKLRQYVRIVILGLLIGVMGWVAMAQEKISLASEDNTELLERIALLKNSVQAQAQEISNLRNKSNDTTKLLSVVESAIIQNKQHDWNLIAMVATYAAMVATGVAVWNVYIGRRDRSRIKMVLMLESSNSGLKAICFIITNVGRRPITLLYWSVKTKNKKYNYISINETLKETDKCEVCAVKDTSQLPGRLENILEIKDFLVRDSTGKEWGLSRKERRQFVTRYKAGFSDDG